MFEDLTLYDSISFYLPNYYAAIILDLILDLITLGFVKDLCYRSMN